MYNGVYGRRFSARRFSRRSALVAAGIVSGTAAFVAACGGEDNKTSGTTSGAQATVAAGSSPTGGVAPAGQPKKGGILRSAGGPLSPDLDVHRINTPWESAGVWHWAGNFLLRFSKDLLPEPDLASAQPEVSDGGTTLIFKLRPEAKWQQRAPANGRNVDGEDVKLTFERIKNPAITSPRASNYANVDKIETPDKNTVVFKLKTPEADLLAKMADQYDLIIPKEMASRDKLTSGAQDVVGSGPYVLDSFVSDQGFKMSRRPDGYWKPNTAWFDGWDVRRVDDPQALLAAYRANQIDAVGVPGDELKNFESDKNSYLLRDTGSTRECLLLNTKKKPYDDIRVRQAIWRAVDRKAIYDKVFAGLGIPGGPMTPAATTWVLPDDELAKLPGFKKDRDAELKEAKQLLAAAGFPDGFEDTMTTVTAFMTEQEADLYVPQVARIGIKYKLENIGTDFFTFLQREVKGEYTAAATLFLSGPYPDAQLNLYHKTGGTRNYAGLSDPKLDALLDAQSKEFDTNKRKQLVFDIQRYIIENPAQVWVGSRVDVTAYRTYYKGIFPMNVLAGYVAAENGFLDK